MKTIDSFGEYLVIPTEIPFKQKGYIQIIQSSEELYREAIDAACTGLIQRGAEKVYASCIDKSIDVPPAGFQTANYAFRFEHEMDYLETELADFRLVPVPEGIALQNVTRDNIDDFLRIYNTVFFAVPNAASYTQEDTDHILGESGKSCAGFLMRNGEKVGMYELSFEEQTPEILAIGLLDDQRGHGLGQQFLASLLDELLRMGYPKAGLRVSTANPTAYGLYLKTFKKVKTVSRWYVFDTKQPR